MSVEIPAALQGRIADIVRSIPRGKVMSYGQIAAKLGIEDSRIVGWAMHDIADDAPWWRVINNEGKLTIKNDALRLKQRELLMAEGVRVNENFTLDIEQYRHGTVPGQKKLL